MASLRLGFLVFLALFFCLPPVFANDQGWVLTQRSSKFGDQYVYVSGQGLKLVVPRQGCNLVTSAPTWNVCFYNDKTKMFYATSYAQWMRDVARRMSKSELAGKQWSKNGPSDVSGLKATKYTVLGGGKSLRHADCWVSNDIRVPSQISQMLAQAYGLPVTDTFPLKVSYVSMNGSLSSVLDTYRLQTTNIPAGYFGLPPGYKRVASQEEVMMDDETQSILRDLVSDGPSR